MKRHYRERRSVLLVSEPTGFVANRQAVISHSLAEEELYLRAVARWSIGFGFPSEFLSSQSCFSEHLNGGWRQSFSIYCEKYGSIFLVDGNCHFGPERQLYSNDCLRRRIQSVVALSFSGAPALSTCSLSSSSVTLNGSAPSTVTVLVTTGGTSAKLLTPVRFPLTGTLADCLAVGSWLTWAGPAWNLSGFAPQATRSIA
jgi:hypothetical protein